jgi:hypothetical protein
MSLKKFFNKPFLIRLLNWEYWNADIVYAPIYPIITLYCVLSGFRYFFSASNPRITNGGFLMESKEDIYPLMPESFMPRTFYFKQGIMIQDVIQSLSKNKFNYPLIIKPNIGLKGYAVKKVDNENELKKYLPFYTLNFHIQEFVPYKNEVGIFYYRFPGKEKGKISGIVSKEFLKVTGDGISTLQQLLMKDKRCIIQLESLKIEFAHELERVLDAGETKVLVPYGNHARGAKFINDTQLVDEELQNSFDDICRQIPDFYFGRMDIRYDNWEDLRHGKKFAIVELNGAGSEPTHIYDPKHSIFFAWYEIVRHWTILWKISRINHRKGHAYLSAADGTSMFVNNHRHTQKLIEIHKRILSLN